MSERMRRVLYHFTCQHGHADIERSGVLLPHVHVLMTGLGPLLWLTDLADPTPESVGLTSAITHCDRLAYRYVVRTRAAVAWSALRAKAPVQVVADMESLGSPAHWWVARRPLLRSEFVLDASWRVTPAPAPPAPRS